ncbi:Hypothetical predicted protein [Podarcis lilfordi]|uniref:Uncharacterized protein n=1 Tax=Podarcis lilfordi TaxID=74358 RepID=A0AA35NSL3_9SAUR|nr:Hypothetical predicted protein [Podarcis lilfordi]
MTTGLGSFKIGLDKLMDDGSINEWLLGMTGKHQSKSRPTTAPAARKKTAEGNSKKNSTAYRTLSKIVAADEHQDQSWAITEKRHTAKWTCLFSPSSLLFAALFNIC